MALLLPGDKRRLGDRGEHRADTEFHRHKRHRKSSEVQGANSNDYFIDNCFPKACYANGNIYIVYADTPTSMQTTDRGDIFMLEASVNWSTHALAVSTGPKGVNNDGTQTDPWDPSIAVNPSGTELFVGYYSRQNDPVTTHGLRREGIYYKRFSQRHVRVFSGEPNQLPAGIRWHVCHSKQPADLRPGLATSGHLSGRQRSFQRPPFSWRFLSSLC